MDLEEVGAHILLMCAAAASPERYRIHADDHAIRMRLRNPSDDTFQKIKNRLLSGAWKLSADGIWWEQYGLRRTFEKQAAFSEKQRGNALAKWHRKDNSTLPDSSHKDANVMPDTMPDTCSSFASASTNQTLVKHEKRVRRKVDSDPRHTPIKEVIVQAWELCNKGMQCPWSGADAKCLALFLKANPKWEVDEIKNCIRNWVKSDTNHSDPPRAWLSTLEKYLACPLDRFGKQIGVAPPTVAPTRNLTELLEKAQRKLAASGFTRNLVVELDRIKNGIKSRMSPDDWQQWIAPLAGGCGNKDEIICFAPSGDHAEHVIEHYCAAMRELAAADGFEVCKVYGL